jgi:hypothetical protein
MAYSYFLFPRALWFVMVIKWKQTAKIWHLPSPNRCASFWTEVVSSHCFNFYWRQLTILNSLDCRLCVHATMDWGGLAHRARIQVFLQLSKCCAPLSSSELSFLWVLYCQTVRMSWLACSFIACAICTFSEHELPPPLFCLACSFP